jgi:hypothetical protein
LPSNGGDAVIDAGEPSALPHTYRLGGQSCLAGDVIGDYSFAKPLQIGQRALESTPFGGQVLPQYFRMDDFDIRIRLLVVVSIRCQESPESMGD